jgi:RES domain-containing protein
LKTCSWRVVKQRFASQAFDGDGACISGGRWNSAGRAVVYTAASTSLGLLEKLVHTEKGLLPFYVTIPVTFDADLVEIVEPQELPASWRSLPAPSELQRIGNEWIDLTRSCILEVPSVIVPHESNFILNPNHPDFSSLEIGDPISLETDLRLV